MKPVDFTAMLVEVLDREILQRKREEKRNGKRNKGKKKAKGKGKRKKEKEVKCVKKERTKERVLRER